MGQYSDLVEAFDALDLELKESKEKTYQDKLAERGFFKRLFNIEPDMSSCILC